MANDLFSYPPRLMGRAEAARYLGCSITTFDEMVADGTFPKPKKIKSKLVWDRVDLDLAASDLSTDDRTVKQKMLDYYRENPTAPATARLDVPAGSITVETRAQRRAAADAVRLAQLKQQKEE